MVRKSYTRRPRVQGADPKARPRPNNPESSDFETRSAFRYVSRRFRYYSSTAIVTGSSSALRDSLFDKMKKLGTHKPIKMPKRSP